MSQRLVEIESNFDDFQNSSTKNIFQLSDTDSVIVYFTQLSPLHLIIQTFTHLHLLSRSNPSSPFREIDRVQVANPESACKFWASQQTLFYIDDDSKLCARKIEGDISSGDGALRFSEELKKYDEIDMCTDFEIIESKGELACIKRNADAITPIKICDPDESVQDAEILLLFNSMGIMVFDT